MRNKQPTEVRQVQIAEAALRLIGSQGIAALTMATLAAEVGVTTGALFRHFPSREAILAAVACRVAALMDATLPPSALPPLERLSRLAEDRVALMRRQPELVAILFSEQVLLAMPASAVEQFQGIVVRTGALIASALTEARAAGEIRTDVPLPDLVALTMGTMRHLTFLSSSPLGGKMATGRSVADIWQSYLTLIRPGGGHAVEF